MVLSLEYGRLGDAVSSMNKLDAELGSYCDDLSRKVQQKMYDVEGGTSSALRSADYYVKEKIKKLQTRAENARDLSSKTQGLLDTAKRVDSEVKSVIERNRDLFFQKNSHLKPANYKVALIAFWCEAKKVPILGFLLKTIEEEVKALAALGKIIRHWYECGGGKELIGIVLSITVAVAAVILLALACVFTGGGILAVIIFVAGIIGAVIAVVNAVTDVVTSIQAHNAARDGHPGMARILSGRDKLSDVLREHNFKDREKNRASGIWATTIDVVEAVCNIVDLADGIAKVAKGLKNIDNVKSMIKKVFEAGGAGKGAQGKFSLFEGIKSIAMKFDLETVLRGDFNTDAIKGIGDVKDGLQNFKDVKNFKDVLMGMKDTLVGLKNADHLEKLVKAVSGVAGNLGDVNSGERTLLQFAGSRLTSGIYEGIGQTEIINNMGDIISKLGVVKLITDFDNSGAVSYVNNSDDGIIQAGIDIVKAFKPAIPGIKIPKIPMGINLPAPIVGIDLPLPPGGKNINLPTPTFALPNLDLRPSLERLHPYYNVA